ncbi:MICOS complex subunit MIC13-like [Gigantopelta aegis]|uniref:MICOS complex subunit MIC13-like n=1 Tax=Gigantopelta aegis TaxID=1735272 RepID=UPI001B88CB57|nr:MICOS complex subunit MIC13-like [Gigantopelta aegis]
MALTLLKTASKVAIGAGAMYITIDYGVWGNSNQASESLEHFKRVISPVSSEYLKKSTVPEATWKSEGTGVKNVVIDRWNNGVKKTFSYLYDAPETACKYIKQGYASLTSK